MAEKIMGRQFVKYKCCAEGWDEHRQDKSKCPDCKRWVCAWHHWVGDDNEDYCPKCAPKHRKDGRPKK